MSDSADVPLCCDDGITLVELLIYMFLSIIVLTIVGAVLINSFRVESQVRDAAQSASTAQLIAESIGVGVRNASAIQLTEPAPGTLLLRTRSIDLSGAGDWNCQAWIVVGGELRTTRSTTAISGNPTAAATAGWTLLAADVKRVRTAPTAPPSSLAPLFAISGDARSLDVRLSVGIADGIPVLIDTVMVAQQPIPIIPEAPICFP